MTKKEANQLYYINREIRMWQRELDKLRNQSNIKGQNIDGMPRGSNKTDKVSKRAIKIVEIEETIRKLHNKAIISKAKIMKYIESIPDSCDRQIFFLRAAACLPWSVIANELGGDNTEDSVRMRYNRIFISKK